MYSYVKYSFTSIVKVYMYYLFLELKTKGNVLHYRYIMNPDLTET